MVNRESLLFKILAKIGIPVAIAFCVAAVIVLITVSNSSEKLTDSDLYHQSEVANMSVESYFEKYESLTRTMALEKNYETICLQAQPGVADMQETQIFPTVFASLVNIRNCDADSILYSWVADFDTRQYILSTGYFSAVEDPDFDMESRVWYKPVIQTDSESILSEPYEEISSGDMVVSVCSPVYKSGTTEMVGATCLDISTATMVTMVAETKIGENGFLILIPPSGNVFYHPNPEYENLPLAETGISQNILDAVAKGGSEDVLEYTVDGDTMYGYVSPVGDSGWTLITALPESEYVQAFAEARRNIIIVFGLAILLIAALIVMTAKSIVRPLGQMSLAAEELAKGNVNIAIDYNKKDEMGVLAESMGKVTRSIAEMSGEATMLANAAAEGNLSVRGDAEKFEGAYKDIIDGVNSTLERLTNAINLTTTYVTQISKGDLPEPITVSYPGDYKKIVDSVNVCIAAISNLVSDSKILVETMVEGKLRARADSSTQSGSYAEIINGVNLALDTLVGHIDVLPSPVMIIDRKFDILYINKNGAEMLGRTAKEIEGSKCYDHISSGDCKTENCVCSMAMRENRVCESEATAHPAGQELEILHTGIALKNSKNETVAGIELIVDQTEIVKAMQEAEKNIEVAKKQAEYQDKEVDSLIVNLEKLAHGNLTIETSVGEADSDTYRIKQNFESINSALEETVLNIRAYVEETSEVLEGIGNGNLQQEITADYKGDFRGLKESLNNIINSLSKIMGDINDAADQVAVGAQQVAEGSQMLSQGATEQASSVEELNSSVGVIAEQTKQNALNASEARELSTNVMEEAEQGNSQMQNMLKAMADIDTSSANISQVIKVIDDIAFQTNILALNAAVEAARAGEQGKGFAVVAEEVRNLAARSADAAKKTTAMIEDSIKNVQNGTAIVNNKAKALAGIVTGIENSTNLVGSIAEASNEQASGIAQINKGIEQVAKVVHDISSTSEESATASEELSQQAVALKDMVGNFKIKR